MSMMINSGAKVQQFSSQEKSRTLENHDFGPLRRKILDKMCMKFRICMKFLSFIKRTTAPFRTQDALSNRNPLMLHLTRGMKMYIDPFLNLSAEGVNEIPSAE